MPSDVTEAMRVQTLHVVSVLQFCKPLEGGIFEKMMMFLMVKTTMLMLLVMIMMLMLLRMMMVMIMMLMLLRMIKTMKFFSLHFFCVL